MIYYDLLGYKPACCELTNASTCNLRSVLRIARASINCETSINNTAHHLAKLRSLTVGMNMDMDSVKAAALK